MGAAFRKDAAECFTENEGVARFENSKRTPGHAFFAIVKDGEHKCIKWYVFCS